MNIYFAHSLLDYRTPKTVAAVAAIQAQWPEATVHNPENFEKGFRTLADKYGWPQAYLLTLRNKLGKEGMVVVTEYQGGIGKGCFTEIRHALDTLHVPVKVLRDGQFHDVLDVVVANAENWKVGYGKLVLATGVDMAKVDALAALWLTLTPEERKLASTKAKASCERKPT